MKMQAFYTQLSHALEVFNPSLAHLAALTKVGLKQAQILKTNLSWNEWIETSA